MGTFPQFMWIFFFHSETKIPHEGVNTSVSYYFLELSTNTVIFLHQVLKWVIKDKWRQLKYTEVEKETKLLKIEARNE